MTKYHALMWYFCVLTIQSYDCYIVCCEAVVTVTFFFWRWSLIVLVWDITNEPVGLTIETIKRSNWNDSYWLLCPAVRWLLNRTLFSVLRSGAGYLLCCLNNSYGPFIVLCLNPPPNHHQVTHKHVSEYIWSREALVVHMWISRLVTAVIQCISGQIFHWSSIILVEMFDVVCHQKDTRGLINSKYSWLTVC